MKKEETAFKYLILQHWSGFRRHFVTRAACKPADYCTGHFSPACQRFHYFFHKQGLSAPGEKKYSRVFKVYHTDDQVEEELSAIVDAGGTDP